MSKSHWLLKTEPETYSFDDLVKDRKTAWNGVRNFQARNFIKEMKAGDFALIYHSGEERAVVGIAKVNGAPYPELDPKKKGEWFQIDLVPVKPLPSSVTLQTIKGDSKLKNLLLIRQSRLSVMPVEEKEYERILHLGGLK